MTIIRSPRIQRNFTVISNSVCLDERLSMRALGLLVRLLSRPDNWTTNSASLASEFGVGREQMRGVLQELSEAGYMELRKEQDKSGRWSSYWIVFDEPRTAVDAEQHGEDVGSPKPGKPYFGALGPITRTDLTRTNTPQPPKGGDEPPGFAEFWSSWPQSQRKQDRKKCAEKWRRKGFGQKLAEIVAHVEAMKQSKQWRDGFEPAPLTYLNGERWCDGMPAEAETSDTEGYI